MVFASGFFSCAPLAGTGPATRTHAERALRTASRQLGAAIAFSSCVKRHSPRRARGALRWRVSANLGKNQPTQQRNGTLDFVVERKLASRVAEVPLPPEPPAS